MRTLVNARANIFNKEIIVFLHSFVAEEISAAVPVAIEYVEPRFDHSFLLGGTA